MKSYPTLELRTPSGQRLSLEARPYSWQLMCVDNMPTDNPAVTHLSFRKEQLDALVDFIRRMRSPEACKPAHTCIQCAYCDMWDMTCANIDNADNELNRMPILSDTPACKHFTPEEIK